jgi:hypothetical protein
MLRKCLDRRPRFPIKTGEKRIGPVAIGIYRVGFSAHTNCELGPHGKEPTLVSTAAMEFELADKSEFRGRRSTLAMFCPLPQDEWKILLEQAFSLSKNR